MKAYRVGCSTSAFQTRKLSLRSNDTTISGDGTWMAKAHLVSENVHYAFFTAQL